MQVETRHYEFFDDVKKCNDISETALDASIETILKKEGYVSCDVTKKVLPADGGNYLGRLCEIDAKGKTADGEKDTALFVKSVAENASSKLISLPAVYENELFMYKELGKIYNELQDEANVPLNQRFNTVKCYEESRDMTVIMENVTRKGFKTWSRMDVIPLSMAEESMKQLARFHGLSFVLQEKRPEYFEKKIVPKPPVQDFGKTWNDFIDKLVKESMEHLDADLRNKIEKKLPEKLKKMEEYITDASIKYCLCHGDYRPNNIMVKEKDGIVTDVIPVDYQIIYYGCPVVDIIYFIYMATDRRFRDAHVVHLKDLYYSSLDEFLRYFDMSAESVFPRKLFENLFEEKLDFSIVVAFVILQFVFVSENDEIPDIMNPLATLSFKLDDRYKDRLTEFVQEMIDLGIL